MIGFPPSIDDEDLHAFVDGEAEPDRREAILRLLAASPADAARADLWRRQNETIRAAFAGVEAEPLPASVPLPAPESRRRFACKLLSGRERFAGEGKAEPRAEGPGRLRQACLLLATFASGIMATVGANMLADRIGAADRSALTTSDRVQAPTESDAIFVGRTVSALQSFTPAPAAARPAAAIPNQTAVAQDRTALILPNLSSAGLRLAGVRVAPSEFDRMFCFFYTEPSNVSLALCVEKVEDQVASGFHQIGHFPLAAIDWRQRGARYALAGGLADAELRSLAEKAGVEIDAFDAR